MTARRQPGSSSNLLVQLGRALVALGRILFGRPRSRLNRVQLLADFVLIEQLLDSNDPIHAAQAIMRADSFLDQIMKVVGCQGATFADRLRGLKRRFDRILYQQIWEAHKIRNQIAHESTEISSAQARNFLPIYRRAASALGAF